MYGYRTDRDRQNHGIRYSFNTAFSPNQRQSLDRCPHPKLAIQVDESLRKIATAVDLRPLF